jgi:hypothetical protein
MLIYRLVSQVSGKNLAEFPGDQNPNKPVVPSKNGGQSYGIRSLLGVN